MIIKFEKFKIIELSQNKFGEFDFSDSINIIEGNNTIGKSTLMKSIMHCLGFKIGKWAESFSKDDFIFILHLKINEIPHTIIRCVDSFIVDEKCYSEKEYRTILNELLGITIRLAHKTGKVPVQPYPSDLFLFSYIDQDTSYSNLFKGNHSTLGMYKPNEVYRVFKHLIGIETSELDELYEQKNRISNNKKAIQRQKDGLMDLLEQLEVNDKDLIPLSKVEFDKMFLSFAKNMNEVMQEKNVLEHKKFKIVKRLKELDIEIISLEDAYDNLDELPSETQCRLCKSDISHRFLNEYKNQLNKNSLITLYANCKKEMKSREEELNSVDDKIKVLSLELENLEKKYSNMQQKLDLNKILEANANLKLKEKIEENITAFQEKIKAQDDKIKAVEKKIKEQSTAIREREKEIKEEYEKRLEEVSKIFKNSNFGSFENNFMNFKIDKTGSQLNIGHVALYYVYFSLMTKFSRIKFPIIWDSIIKDAFDGVNDEYLNTFVNEKILKLNTQIIFSNIPNSPKDIKILYKTEYNYLKLNDGRICSKTNGEIENKSLDKIFKILGE